LPHEEFQYTARQFLKGVWWDEKSVDWMNMTYHLFSYMNFFVTLNVSEEPKIFWYPVSSLLVTEVLVEIYFVI